MFVGRGGFVRRPQEPCLYREDEHEARCETEMATTQQKKAEHEANVARLTREIANTTEVIEEKIQAIADTEPDITETDEI